MRSRSPPGLPRRTSRAPSSVAAGTKVHCRHKKRFPWAFRRPPCLPVRAERMVAGLLFQEIAVYAPPRDAPFWESPFPTSRQAQTDPHLGLSKPGLIESGLIKPVSIKAGLDSWSRLPSLSRATRQASARAAGRELAPALVSQISESPESAPGWLEQTHPFGRACR